MPENPETLNSKFDKAGPGDGSLASLGKQIEMHKQADQNKSVLDKLVQLVYHKDDDTLEQLTKLKQEALDRAAKGGAPAVAGMRDEIKLAIQNDRDAVKGQNEVNFYAGTFVKAVPLFAGAKSRMMMAGSITAYGLDAVREKDTLGEAATNFAMGGTKGFALKKTFDFVGAKSFSMAAEGQAVSTTSKYLSIGLKGTTLGTASRVFETGLTSSTYVGEDGKLSLDSFRGGVSKTFSSAFDAQAMVMDAGLFMGAHGAFTGLTKVGGRMLSGTSIAENLASSSVGKFARESQLLPNMGMGATFGFSAGATGEFMRQKDVGEGFDIARMLKRGALQAITDGAAGGTGASAVHLTRVRPMDAAQNVAPARESRAFAGEEAPPANAGKVVEKTGAEKTGAEKTDAEKTDDGSNNDGKSEVIIEAPADLVQPVVKTVVPAELAELTAKPEKAVDTQLHPVHESLKAHFEKASGLAVKAVDSKAAPEDVVAFFEYASGEGRSVRAPMESLAKQAKEFANIPMEKLIKEAYNTRPETIATLKEGVELAQSAAKNDASPVDVYKLLDYAYGQGRGAEVPLRMVAELTGDNSINRIVQEAYAGANNLTRVIQRIDRITDPIPQPVKESFRDVMTMPITNAAEHMQFRESAKQWARDNPGFTDLMNKYGNQTKNGVHAAVIDNILGTNILSRFPDRSVTSPNLFEELQAASQRRSLDSDAEGVVDTDIPVGTVKEAPVRADAETINQAQEPKVFDADAAASQRIEAARVLAERVAAQNGDQSAISHQDGRAVITPETLIKEFQQAQGTAKTVKGTILSEFFGKMSDADFADWLTHAYKPANQPGMHTDVNNLATMQIGNGRVLNRGEVRDALSNPDNAKIDIPTLRKFLSAPEKLEPGVLSEAEMTNIGHRLQLAYERLQTKNDMNPETAGQPVDNMAVLREALPNNYLKSLRERFSKPAEDGSGAYEYPAGFDQNLANWLEAARIVDMKHPKYRPPRTNTNQLSDRLNVLDLAIDMQNASGNPALVNKLLDMGTQNHFALKMVLEKLDPTKSAPEYTELLNLVAPRTSSLADVTGMMDAIQFGNKSNQNANKARDTGKDASFHDTNREVNEAFALSVVNRLIPQNDPGWSRAQQIVSNIISGKIRDPRPEGGFGGPGGAGGGFQRPGQQGNRPPFQRRGQDSPQERPRVEQPLRGEEPNNFKPKPVQPEQQLTTEQVRTQFEGELNTKPIEVALPVHEEPVVLDNSNSQISQGLADLLKQGAEKADVVAPEPVVKPTVVAREVAEPVEVVQPDKSGGQDKKHQPQIYTVEDAASGKNGGKGNRQKRGRQQVEEDDDWGGDYKGSKRDKLQRGGKRDFKRGFDE